MNKIIGTSFTFTLLLNFKVALNVNCSASYLYITIKKFKDLLTSIYV